MPSKYIAPAVIIALSLGASRGEMLYAQPIEVLTSTPEADGVWASDGYGYVLSISSEDKAPQLLHAATPPFSVPPIPTVKSLFQSNLGDRPENLALTCLNALEQKAHAHLYTHRNKPSDWRYL